MDKTKLPLIAGACCVTVGMGGALYLDHLRRQSTISRYDREVHSHLEVGEEEEEEGSVHVVTSAAEWARLHPRLCRDLALVPVLGLDCEWVGAGPVSLLQLATFSGLCILVRSVEEYFES